MDITNLIYKLRMYGMPCHGQHETLMQQAASALEEQQKRIEELEAQNRWIPVTERLPKNFESVLGYMPASAPFPPVRECYTVGNAFYFPALQDVQMVSHWKPMPEGPREDV